MTKKKESIVVTEDEEVEEIKSKELNEARLEEMWLLKSPREKIDFLCAALEVEHYYENQRTRAWVDYCFYGLVFAKEESKFSIEKTMILFSIMNLVFEHATSFTEDSPQPTMEENYQLLKNNIKLHSLDLPPDCVQVFSVDEVKLIVKYMTTTFYRHFEAYQYAYRVRQRTIRVYKQIVVETPLIPYSLEQAITPTTEETNGLTEPDDIESPSL